VSGFGHGILSVAAYILVFHPACRDLSGYFYKDDINIQNVLEEEVICSFISKPFNHDEILKAIDKVSARSEV